MNDECKMKNEGAEWRGEAGRGWGKMSQRVAAATKLGTAGVWRLRC
jgi:hypothetical protein